MQTEKKIERATASLEKTRMVVRSVNTGCSNERLEDELTSSRQNEGEEQEMVPRPMCCTSSLPRQSRQTLK